MERRDPNVYTRLIQNGYLEERRNGFFPFMPDGRLKFILSVGGVIGLTVALFIFLLLTPSSNPDTLLMGNPHPNLNSKFGGETTLKSAKSFSDGKKYEKTDGKKKYVIVDTDAGIDDAWALFLALRAHQDPSNPFTIIGITTTTGNTRVDNVLENVERVLQTMPEENIPLIRGADTALVHPLASDDLLYFGLDGFGDAELPPINLFHVVKGLDAARGIWELVGKYKENKVTVICLGPLTNIAEAYKLNPKLPEFIDQVYFLGGNYEGAIHFGFPEPGNTKGLGNLPVGSEFNVFADPEAAQVVLDNFGSPPIKIIPWETGQLAKLDYAFRRNTLGNMKTTQMSLLNLIEEKMLRKNREGWQSSDPLAMAILLEPKISTKSENFWAAIELQGNMTRGMMLVDKFGRLGKTPNLEFTTGINVDLFKEMLVWAAGGPHYSQSQN